MNEPLPTLVEHSLQIAWDFLDRSGEITDAGEAARFLLTTINDLVLRGERRKLLVSNRAIDAYRRHKQSLAA